MGKKTLILGKGYLGKRLSKELKCPVSAKRINTFKDVESLIKTYKPKVLINCIGHNGERNVDDCERKLDKTLNANTFVPTLLAEAAIRHNIKFVHIGSGCIYHYDYKKSKPINEDTVPDFYDLYYSRTKIYAEGILKELAKRNNILILRIRVPLDDRPHNKNILTKLIAYKSVIDVPNSITYIPDFIKTVKHLIKKDARGIYNCTLAGSLKYSSLLNIYQKYIPNFEYSIIPLSKLTGPRTNLILSTNKLKRSGFKLRRVSDVLDECVKNYIKHKPSRN